MLKRTRIQEPPHVGDFTVQQVEAKIAALKKAKFVVDKEIRNAEMKKDMRLMKTKRTSQSGIHIIINEFIMVSLIYA